jgi:hypothetical protein
MTVSFGAAEAFTATVSNNRSIVVHNRVMRVLLIIGGILLVLGIVSLVVPIPTREHHGLKAGGVSIGIETVEHQKVPPAISVVLIAGGVALMIAGSRKWNVR